MAEVATIRKLRQLVLLLSSDQPGEVVAAARAITRALKAAGADWHDLAATVERPPAAHQVRRPAAAPNTPKWSSLPPETRGAVLDWIRNEPWLSPWECEFTTSIGEQFALYGGNDFSPKQIAVLDRLLRRAMEHGGKI